MNRKTKAGLTALIVLPVLAGIALATPGVNVISAPVHARGTHEDRLAVYGDKIHLKAKHGVSVDFATQQIVIGPGGATGWHSHPGPVLVTVKTGELTLVYADDPSCEGRTYRAGQSFVDRGSEMRHIALNKTPANVELWATYLIPGAPGTPFRIDEAAPGHCTF
jgi:quercetin dioxygenase-like cupin family protein